MMRALNLIFYRFSKDLFLDLYSSPLQKTKKGLTSYQNSGADFWFLMSFIIIPAIIFIEEFLILRSLQNHFGTLVFEVHTRIGRRRTGPGSRCSRRRRLKTTQQLWRANFTQFSPRASQLNLERRSVCKTQTSVGNIVVVTAFFSW